MIDKSVLKREGIILLAVAAIGVASLLIAWAYRTLPLDHTSARILSRVGALGFSCVVFVYPAYQLFNFIIWLVEWVKKK